MNRLDIFKNRSLCSLLLLTIAYPGYGAVFDVSNPAEFQSALSQAQSNGQDDTINVGVCSGDGCSIIAGQSVYTITQPLTYTASASENQELTIAGFDSDSRILDGVNGVPIMQLDARGATNDFNTIMTVQDLTFARGNSADDGGALSILVEGSQVTVTGSVFVENDAGDNGGALFVRIEGAGEGNLHLADVTFDSNEALGIPNGGSGSGGNGGSVYVQAAGLTGVSLIDIDFLNSTADRNGGCIAVEGLDPSDPVFRRIGQIAVQDVLFQDCSAGLFGGGAFFAASNFDIRASGFVRNSAPQTDGGGLYVARDWSSFILINTGFASNTAYQGGGLFLTDGGGGFAQIINNTFYQNTATDGDGGNAYLAFGGSTGLARIYNNIIYNGSAAGFGDDVFIDNDPFTDIPSEVEFIANNLGEVPVAPNFQNDFFEIRSSAELTLSDNIDTMPLLPGILDVEPDPKQAQGSPTIDAGRTDLITFGEDFEGDIRPIDGDGDMEAVVDIGMDEFVPGALPSADVAVTADGSPAPATALEELTYAILVTNNGPDQSSDTSLSVSLAAGLTFGSATPSQGSCSLSGSVVTCELGNLAESGDVNVTLVTTAPNVMANTALVTSFSVANAESDPTVENNTTSVETVVVPAGPIQADLEITKNAAPSPIFSRGEALVYTVTVQNNGPDDSSGVVLLDTLPTDDVVFVSASLSNGGSCNSPDSLGVLSCELGSIAVESNVTATITVQPNLVSDPTIIANSASVSATEEDPIATNNAATVQTTVNPPRADLAVSVASNDTEPLINEQLSYTVTVTNAGPSDGESVQLSITLPEDTTVQSVTPGQGQCSVDDEGSIATAICSIGALSIGASVDTEVLLTGPAVEKSVTLVAMVSGDADDPQAVNNSAQATIAVIDAVPIRVRGRGGKSSAIGLLELLTGMMLLWTTRLLAAKRFGAVALAPVLIVVGALLPLSSAQAEPYYLGVAGGRSNIDYSKSDLTSDLANRGWVVSDVSLDDSDTAWKLYAGYQFNDWAAVEAGYVELGKVRTGYSAEVPPNQITNILSDTVDVHPYLGSGWTLAGVGRWGMGDGSVGLLAKAGVFVWEADIEVKVVQGASGRVTGDEDGTDLYYGVGAYWNVNPRVSLTLEWDRYHLNDWVDVPMFGVRVSF